MIANRLETVSAKSGNYPGAPLGTPHSLNAHRPSALDAFVGQEHLKAIIKTTCLATRKQNAAFPHTLLSGASGLGKTTLSQIIATERGVAFIPKSAVEIGDQRSLQHTLASLDAQGYDHRGVAISTIAPTVLFVDEIHRLNRAGQELMYLALEDRIFEKTEKNIYTGELQVSRMWIPHFTLIAATNRPSDLTAAFRDRLRLNLALEQYPDSDLAIIARQTLVRSGLRCGEDAAIGIASRGRGVPRRVIGICETVVNVCVAHGTGLVSPAVCEVAFKALGIDPLGLSRQEVRLLRHLADSGAPVGMTTLAAVIGEDERSVEASIEPFLLSSGLIARTVRGRTLTPRGLAHLRDRHGYGQSVGGKA